MDSNPMSGILEDGRIGTGFSKRRGYILRERYGNAKGNAKKYFGIFSSQNERGVWRPGIGAMVALYVG
jgi:hypothetical protein